MKAWRWLVKNRVCVTRWRHRTSTRCWRSDGASKENLRFDYQSKEVVSLFSSRSRECLGELEKLWKHSPTARVPTAFLVLQNFHLCFYLRIEIENMYHVSIQLYGNTSGSSRNSFPFSLNCGIKIEPAPKRTGCCTCWTGVGNKFDN